MSIDDIVPCQAFFSSNPVIQTWPELTQRSIVVMWHLSRSYGIAHIMHILIIYDGKPGHLSPSLGLYQLLSSHSKDKHTYEIALSKPILKGLNRPIRLLAQHFVIKFHKLIMRFYGNPTYEKKPDLIISFGGNSIATNFTLAKKIKCMNIAIGNIYGFDETSFTLNLSIKNCLGKDKHYIPFSKLDVDVCNALGENLKKRNHKPFYTLLIGGDGSGYKYTYKDYADLIGEIKEIALSQNITWIISTSRRTPSYVTELINNIPLNACFNLLDYHHPNTSLEEILGACERIFITEDSLSMISEALSLSKPIYTLSPKSNETYGVHKNLVKRLHSDKYIKRMKIVNLSSYLRDSLSVKFNTDYTLHSKAKYHEITLALSTKK